VGANDIFAAKIHIRYQLRLIALIGASREFDRL
jgi:hypothetical protein